MKSNLFVLHNVSDFAPGAFENVAVEEGCMQLGRTTAGYLENGCYTSPPFKMEEFSELIPSWNVDTPQGTYVEVEARVNTNGKWSKWFSFGKWSPFIKRSSPERSRDGAVMGRVGRIVVKAAENEAEVFGTAAQVRIWLYSENPNFSPMVHLLAISTRPKASMKCSFSGTTEIYKMPAYSCLVREPSISARIAVPTALAMMMNRFGEDVLPEEVARSMYDAGNGRFGNLAFISAAAGMFGYECFARYLSAGELKKELRYGKAVAAMVKYRAPNLAAEALDSETLVEVEAPVIEERQADEKIENADINAQSTAANNLNNAPVLEGAAQNSSGHLVLVRGFSEENGEQFVHISDPLATRDSLVERTIKFKDFCDIYYGFFYTLCKMPKWTGSKEKAPGFARPERRLTQLSLDAEGLHLSAHGEVLEFGEDLPVNVSKATIAYTLSDGVAYASAAQKKFYYLSPDENNNLSFDRSRAEGRKLTVYLIGPRGTTWIAEKSIAKPPKRV